jgi:hypothetical protein
MSGKAITLFGHSGSQTKSYIASNHLKIIKRKQIKKLMRRKKAPIQQPVLLARLIANSRPKQLTKKAQVLKKI